MFIGSRLWDLKEGIDDVVNYEAVLSLSRYRDFLGSGASPVLPMGQDGGKGSVELQFLFLPHF